jgi:hypothetical protein
VTGSPAAFAPRFIDLASILVIPSNRFALRLVRSLQQLGNEAPKPHVGSFNRCTQCFGRRPQFTLTALAANVPAKRMPSWQPAVAA